MTRHLVTRTVPVRIQRDGAWQNVDFHTLTGDELRAFANLRDPFEGWLWARRLAILLANDEHEAESSPEGTDS